MTKEILVTKHFNQFNPGEIASFPDEIAQDIIERKLGREVKRDKAGKIIEDRVDDAAIKPLGESQAEPVAVDAK